MVNAGQRHIKDTPFNNACYAVDKAKQMAAHTITICSNPNVFNSQYFHTTQKITDMALSVYLSSYEANELHTFDPQERKRRLMLQDNAIACCNDLLALIDLAKSVYHLPSKKVVYWGKLVVETKTLLIKWRGMQTDR